MLLSSVSSLLRKANVQENFVRYGHQMCTKNRCHGPTPKYRGIKRKENEEVHSGETIVTQRIIRVLPGMNVGIAWNKNLFALCDGNVKLTSEVFDPNFDHPFTMAQFGNRQGQKMWKRYIHVIPSKTQNRFKLIDAV